MRCFLPVVLLCCSVAAQTLSSSLPAARADNGSFYVNGIVYRYVAGLDYTVVAAAHSAINRKLVAVKIRVYNTGRQPVTLKPEDVRAEDAVAGQALAMVPGTELARKMRRPYNWARLAVNPVAGAPADTATANDFMNPQLLEMMRAMAAKANGSAIPILPGNRAVLYTDSPGALQSRESVQPADCDIVCRLRNREAATSDVLTQLQRQNSPDYVEQNAFLANTITPQSDADGVLYFPMPKLKHGVPLASNGKKAGMVRVTVPVGDETFQFLLVVE